MAARIDAGMVQRLVTAQLATCAIGQVLEIGQEIPDATAELVVLVSVGLKPRRRNSDSDVDVADLSVEVMCTVGDDQSSSYSIGELVSNVAAVLDGAVAKDTGTTHTVQLLRPVQDVGLKLQGDRAIKSGRVTVEGLVTRDTGTTIASYIV